MQLQSIFLDNPFPRTLQCCSPSNSKLQRKEFSQGKNKVSIRVVSGDREPPPVFIFDEDIPLKKPSAPEEKVRPLTGLLSLRTPPTHKSG